MTSREEALDLIRAFAAANELDCEDGAHDGELVVSLPGEKKLKTVCSLVVRDHDVAATAFVIRNADENHEAFYRYLMSRNLRLRGVAYAIDRSGDVYVVGRVPLRGLDADGVDEVLGAVLDASDSAFNELLVLGFLTSMRREWEWRVSRGESLRNLEAFRDILDPERGAAGDGEMRDGEGTTVDDVRRERPQPASELLAADEPSGSRVEP